MMNNPTKNIHVRTGLIAEPMVDAKLLECQRRISHLVEHIGHLNTILQHKDMQISHLTHKLNTVTNLAKDEAYRGEPKAQSFVDRELTGKSFNLLKGGIYREPARLSGNYRVYDCGPLQSLRTDVSESWQGLTASLRFGSVDLDTSIYSDDAIRVIGHAPLSPGLAAFTETSLIPDRWGKPLLEGTVGLNYTQQISTGRFATQLSIGNDSRVTLGVVAPVNKTTSIVSGLTTTNHTNPKDLTIGVRVSPCSHFNVSISDTYQFHEDTHLKQFSLFAEPQIGTQYGLLGSFSHKQPAEILVGFAHEVGKAQAGQATQASSDESGSKIGLAGTSTIPTTLSSPSSMSKLFTGVKLRSFVDIVSMNSKHEVTVPFGMSHVSFSVSLGGDWKRSVPLWSLRMHFEG